MKHFPYWLEDDLGFPQSRQDNPYDRQMSGWVYFWMIIVCLLLIGMFLFAPDCQYAASVIEVSR
jgi:hypothetical protein